MTLRDQLIRDEGRRLKPYTDTTGHVTIGVGRNLTDKGLSLAEAEVLLDHDIADAEIDLQDHLPWTGALDEARRGVLLNMTFNLGVVGLLGFRRMLAAVEAGDWTTAAREMRASHWAEQVGARAERLARQMESGAWA